MSTPVRDLRARIPRDNAYPLPLGANVRIKGRIKECAGLIEPAPVLLDVGCSSGWLAPIVLTLGFKQYVGMDRVIDARDRGPEGAQFVEGSVLNIPFADGSFDAVCMFDVLEHLPRGSEATAIGEIHRVLNDDGKLYFSTPHASVIHAPLDPAWGLGHRHYRRKTIARLFGAAGLHVDRLFVAGGLAECLDHIRLLAYKHLMHRDYPTIGFMDTLIERSHGRDRPLGMTIFAVASAYPFSGVHRASEDRAAIG